jgi:Leucine-rich repeat (LRR) protein
MTKTNLPIAKVPGDVFGYTAAFEEALKKIGQISPLEFAKLYATTAKYLPQISWDPTTAKFWDEFNLDPKENNKNPNRKNWRSYDFRLNPEELAIFKRNGFVVSERLGANNFADLLYGIYSNDLPVFVSADALLHAWHRSFDAILEELEETYLSSSLDEILEGMQQRIPDAWNQYGNGVLGSSVSDADYFLAVASSLLADKAVKTHLNQDARVAETLEAIQGQQLQEFELFGRLRKVDFSQFKVRGHYENSELLKQYFRAMMWCGRIDLRIAEIASEKSPAKSSPRELGAAVILYDLLKQSGKFEQWQQFDQLLQTFVGRTDSMTFAQLGDILDKAKIKSPADVKDLGTLEQLQADILASKIGFQDIRSHYYVSPFDSEKVKLPRSFTLLGQKFVVDSWVTSKVVYDDIEWDGEKVQRRVPSCLDVAFAALGNNQVVPDLVTRMTDTTGREFRDGLNYQHNLAAVRNVIDEQNPAVWEENIYMSWLATLRELSVPTTEAKYPEAMSTRAWAMKTLNTQLASWTQMRHDTILYVKQSYTMSILCYYPAGFVEPRLTFWERFEKMALLAADLIEKTPFPEGLVKASDEWGYKSQVQLQDIQKRQSTFFKNFAEKLAILKGIAVKQLAQEEFTEAENQFLKKIVEIIDHGSGAPTYSGWYFGLFYKGHEDSEKQDAIVADVHTNVPTPGDPGCVLHQGVGNVDLLMIAVDNGKDKMVYAGPVLSHYEFEMPGVSRLSDSEWLNDLKIGKVPPRPDWTNSYLVPLAPKNILELTNQTTLDLSGKELTALPKEIYQLTNLTELNLSNNQLTALPPEIGQLTNLIKLNLSDNQLTALPPEIGNFVNLTELDLNKNPLTVLPAEIGQLSNLTKLSLRRTQLTALPPEIGNLTNLTQLSLSSYQLTVLPAEIGQLSNLTELDLHGTQLTTLPAEIGQLSNLTELNLTDNQLTALPAEIGQLSNLTELNLTDNQLKVLPAEIGQLTNLTTLKLVNNNQLKALPAEIGQLSNLTDLELVNNQLATLPAEIGQLSNLTWLDLHNNQLTLPPPEIVKQGTRAILAYLREQL